MMEKFKQNADKKEEKAFWPRTLEVASYPFSLLVGYFVGQQTIRDGAYNNAKDMDAVGISGEHRARLKAIGAKANREVAAGRTFDLIAATAEEFKEHPGKVSNHLEALHVGSLGKQWQFTSRYQKRDAIMNAATATGISLGALLLITESKIFKDLFSKEPTSQDPER